MIDSLKFYLNFELYGYIDCLPVICDKVVLNLALLKQLGVFVYWIGRLKIFENTEYCFSAKLYNFEEKYCRNDTEALVFTSIFKLLSSYICHSPVISKESADPEFLHFYYIWKKTLSIFCSSEIPLSNIYWKYS